jgi:hypothetical protein
VKNDILAHVEHAIRAERAALEKIDRVAQRIQADNPGMAYGKAYSLALAKLPRTYEKYLDARRVGKSRGGTIL